MNHIENKEKYILLDNLFDFFIDSIYDKEDNLLMKEELIDIDQIVQKNMMLFRQLRTKAKAELNIAKHSRVKEFLSLLKAGLESNVEEYKKMAEDIFSKPKFAELKPMFRNFSDASEEDKKSILIDSKLLDLLSEIESEYYKEFKK